MARTHYIKSRRVGKKGEYVLNCLTCGKPIEYGTPYKYFTMKMSYGGIKKSYHEGCTIPSSHRTTSRMGEIQDAQDSINIPSSFEDDTTGLADIAEEFAQTVRSVSEGYQESADNIEEGFGHSTYQSEELAERASSLESWADDLESLDFEDFEEPDGLEDEIRETLSQDEDESDEDYEERVRGEIETRTEEARQDWWDTQVSLLEDEINNCPV